MSGRRRHPGGHGSQRNRPANAATSAGREAAALAALAPDSPVLTMFKSVATHLTARQDRHERLVKMSRDITIESKRIIFLLHSAVRKEDTEKAVQEAIERLNKLINGPIRALGLELENSPAYLHSHAVSPGFQEFIEAITFCYLMQNKQLISWEEVQQKFQYNVKETGDGEDNERTVVTLLTQNDYMLGLADLTGELMRRAINSISSGESEECFFACQMVRDLYTGFLGLFGTGRELSRKLNTTRTNVFKVEAAVYALRVRGGEAPATHLVPAARPGWERDDEDVDEGFY